MTNEPLLAELIDRSDVVFHLAAAVGVKLIVEQPVHTIETNVHGTEVVLKHANKKKKLVLIASTSEVYGKSTDVPFREDADLVLGPTLKHRWAYACSKAIDEFLALAYWKEKKLPVIIVRLFNTVGPRQTGQYGMVIPNFVRQALAGEPITVFGDGTQSRSFTYVGDVVGALVKLVAGTPRHRAGVQHRQRLRDLDPRPRRAGEGDDREHVPDRERSRTTRRTRPASRTCRGACPTRPDPRAHRLRAEGTARRNPRQRSGLLPAVVTLSFPCFLPGAILAPSRGNP